MNLLENKTVLIIGLGLIGGSIARGLVKAVPGIRILALGRDEAALQSALIDGSIHAYSTLMETLAPQADIVILCTPTLTVHTMLEQLRELLAPEAILTDAASVKGNIVSDARRSFGDSLHRFVPGHPIAGSEQSGYKASKADLFNNRKVILTPLPENSVEAVRTVMQLWQVLGADVHAMTWQRHDEVLAGTSHLPHLLAYTLVNTLVDSVSESDRAQQVFDYAAGGFADFSRIASSDPRMWRDIFLANRDATVDVLDAYIKSLADMRHRLLVADGDGLQAEFARAKRVRDEFIRRFRPSAQEGTDAAPSGFNIESSRLCVRPGSSLLGQYRAPANVDVALEVLRRGVAGDGLRRVDGFPESVAALAAIHDLRGAGMPIVGPERGIIWIYGAQDGAGSSVVLPADPLVSGVIALAAAMMPGSSVELAAVAEPDRFGSLFDCLQELGMQVAVSHGDGDSKLICTSSTLSGARLDIAKTRLSDDELRVFIAAAAVAESATTILLDADRARTVLTGIDVLINWAAEIEIGDGMLVVSPRVLESAELDLGGNVTAALLAIAMAQKVKGQLLLNQPGDLAGHYPGLLESLLGMGFYIEIN